MDIIKRENIIPGLVIILLAGIILLSTQYYVSCQDLKATKSLLQTYQHNEKILNFTRLFIDIVLNAQKEVSFEDRLKLENAVRDLNDKAVLDQWQKFTESQTENQAQQEVKNLLDLLVKKIAY